MSINCKCKNLKLNKDMPKRMVEFNVSQDVIVSDVKPDILEIVNSSGYVCIEKCQMESGRIKLYGLANVQVTYIGNNENLDIRSLETDIQVNEFYDLNMSEEISSADCDAYVGHIDAYIINERKIRVTVTIICTLRESCRLSIDYVDEIEDNRNIQVLNNNMEITRLLYEDKQNINITEEIKVCNDNVLEILSKQINIINEEYKMSYNKILLKAELKIDITYVNILNEILSQTINIPFTGFIELENMSDKDILEIKYNILNIDIKLKDIVQEDKKIMVNASILTNVKQYVKENINIIDDVYSLDKDVSYDSSDVENMNVIGMCTNMQEIKQCIELDEIDCKVLQVNSRINNIENRLSNGKIYIQGENVVEILIKRENKTIVKIYNLPFSCMVDNNIGNIADECEVCSNICNCQYTANGNRVDIILEICFKVKYMKKICMRLLNSLNEEETRFIWPFSITVYYVKEGDSLWKIAKKFKTTIDEIAKYNDIEDPYNTVIQPGMQLFIPKKIFKKVV